MLHETADELSEPTPLALRTGYEQQLRSTITAVGTEAVAAETDIQHERIAAITAGESPTLTVEEAAAILALDAATPDAEAIVYELRDHLLMGMTTAVLDVDTIAANVEVDLTAQEIQQAIEGRTEMTLTQLAAIQSVIDGRDR